MKIKLVIIAGGMGLRLWPLSETNHPKQFIQSFEGKSLFQLTLLRNSWLGKALIIANIQHKDIILSQTGELGIDADFIFEPQAKNTASCALLAGLYGLKNGYDNVMLLPTDHHITNISEYKISVIKAIDSLSKHKISILGIAPTEANGEYGYIELGDKIDKHLYQVAKFIEKPPLQVARKYINDGNYLWNAGIYFYNAAFIINKSQTLIPELSQKVQASFVNAQIKDNELHIDKYPYNEIQPISFDYAIIEKFDQISLVKANFGWADLGNWHSLWNFHDKDSNQNVLHGNVKTHNVSNSYIQSDDKNITVSGLDNVVVISNGNNILVTGKD